MASEMKLKKLIRNLPIKITKGSLETKISGISANSKYIAPGNLFIARKGARFDASRFVKDAVEAGAVAVLSDLYDPFLKDVTQLISNDVVAMQHELCKRYYRLKKKSMVLIGITGTNGKTTTSYLIKHLFDYMNVQCGLIGTNEWIIGDNHFPAMMTTPDVITNHKLLKEMQEEKQKAAIMEVTSHGLEQGRTAGLDFDFALFTNLSQDHLDYHQTMEKYCEAKTRLFSQLSPNSLVPKLKKRAIINGDDPASQAMINASSVPTLTYGIKSDANVRALDLSLSCSHSEFTVYYEGKEVRFSLPMIGRFNVYNALATIALGLAMKFPLEQIAKALENFSGVQGRLQKAASNIYVDFAHTPEALREVLSSLREVCTGKLIVIFGCGGERDLAKRPLMGEIAASIADRVIVTSDNPRSEDPSKICDDICKGACESKNFEVEIDRQRAIEKAIESAQCDDVILIAGKGHESKQIFSDKTIPFNDLSIAQDICMQKSCAL